MKMFKLLENYDIVGDIKFVTPYGNGHINKTYLVATDRERYILQQINTHVFKKPKQVLHNIELVTEQIRISSELVGKDVSRAALRLVHTISGKSYVKVDKEFWRLYVFIADAKSYETVEHAHQMYEVGKAVGIFQKQLHGFPVYRLKTTIPNFHNTPVRYDRFQKVLMKDPERRAFEVYNEIKFVQDRVKKMSILMDLLNSKKVPVRVTHNDTKLNNVMFDNESNKAICMVDLDTVMPGTVLFDFGDAIRIGASTAAEDEKDLSKVGVELEYFKEFTRGFLKHTNGILVKDEIDNLVNSAIVITLECGMRFLTDHIDGDKYFGIKYPNHNLDRARTQFKMVEEMEKKYEDMIHIVKDACIEYDIKF
ncbi:MAG TPA: aminoglycoside phosphotransferase family protein [Bacilli bacterium]|nr:aminoglycoside phosphotransferase family protein [Bacilli bacterium]